MDWFTADLHLGHSNILKYCNRPFQNILEHDVELLKCLNSCVKKTDNLYLIGDIFWKDTEQYLKRINCQNLYFIIGSHDKASFPKRIQALFKTYTHKLVIESNGQT